MSLLAEISDLCRRMTPSAPAFAEVLTTIQQMVPFDAATLFLCDSPHGAPTVSTNLYATVQIPPFLQRKDVGTGNVVLKTKPVLLQTDDIDESFDTGSDYSTIMYVPLIIDDAAIGAVTLGAVQPGVLNDQQLRLMTIVADQLAVSIERLKYIAAIESKNEELHLAQQELRANQKKIVAAEKLAASARMAASINHQINNPLAVILGHVQCLLLEQKDLSGKALQRLNRIEQAAERIANVNRHLLKFDPDRGGPGDSEGLIEPLPETSDH
jgi:signal transduction histidine kinase